MHSRKSANIVVSKPSHGSKVMARSAFRANISENLRQSFLAEGIRFSKEKWDRIGAKASKTKSIRSVK